METVGIRAGPVGRKMSNKEAVNEQCKNSSGETPKMREDVIVINTEMKTYDLDEELRLFESHYGKEQTEAAMAYFEKNGYISNNPARDIHVLVETDLLNQPKEVLDGVLKISDRQQEYDRRYGRGSQPKTAAGRLRARVRKEVYARGIDPKAIDTAMGMPDGWYSKAVNQRGNFEWWNFYYIAKALEIPCDDLFGAARTPELAN